MFVWGGRLPQAAAQTSQAAAPTSQTSARTSQTTAAGWPSEMVLEGFQVHADFELAGYRSLLEELPKLRREVVEQLGLPAATEPIHVFLFARKSAYRGYLDRYFPSAPRRQALFIKQRGPGMIFAHFSPEMAVDLRHEGLHAILHAALPMVPLWLDEGLAEYYEVEPERRRNRRDYLAPTRREVAWGGLPSLIEMESLEEAEQMSVQDYRHAWQWAHYLLLGPIEARGELQAYLRDIAQHVPPGRLSLRLRRRQPDLEEQLQEHWRRSW
jgi:hypothetical protein